MCIDKKDDIKKQNQFFRVSDVNPDILNTEVKTNIAAKYIKDSEGKVTFLSYDIVADTA